MRRRGGFTFLEITVVVVILMLLAAISMPRMKTTMQFMRLRQASRDVAAVMRLARDSAVVRGAPVEVILSVDNKVRDQYQIAILDKNLERIEVEQRRSWHKNNEERFSIPGAEALRVRDLPDGVFFGVVSSSAPLTEEHNRPRVMFYPDGSATAATITLQDVRDRTMNIQVYRATGMSRIEPGSPAVKIKTRTLFYMPDKKR